MTIIRAYRYALDPSPAETEVLRRYANAARCGYNFALGLMVDAHDLWTRGRDLLIEQGMDPAEAAKKAPKVKTPSRNDAQAHFRATRDVEFIGPLPRGVERRPRFRWWEEVNNRAYYTAFEDAATAWKNWRDSHAGRRAGPRVGYPRFKKKGHVPERFRLVHNVKKPEIRFEGPRRLRIPGGGGQPAFTVRLHQTAQPLIREIESGRATVTSLTVRREGHRWFASVLCRVEVELPSGPNPRQRKAGRVGADLGVKHLVALSDPLRLAPDAEPTTVIDNPRLLERTARKLAREQRRMARRYVRGAGGQSKGYQEAKARVARLHADLAARRNSTLHLISKRLVEQYAEVALESLNTRGMTASAKGTAEKPGRNVRQKAGLNRSILDASFAELNRQIEYKAPWHGAVVARVGTYFPSSKTCSKCQWHNSQLTLNEREFRCQQCGMVLDRDANAARNIKAHATPSGPNPDQTPGWGL
ncbi:RNA-guided endonuclease InsQ/TnpB family protein (plasmid) [Streptomyces sp. BI20]|uniref:RNA-guided endonuclease InsQ/TnpB family protein n=1 Tax=Streptomyces sp. BI20 TaxID=3403460 RepID=UPI003C7289E1